MGSMVRIPHPICGLISTFCQTTSRESLSGSGWYKTLESDNLWYCASLQQMCAIKKTLANDASFRLSQL